MPLPASGVVSVRTVIPSGPGGGTEVLGLPTEIREGFFLFSWSQYPPSPSSTHSALFPNSRDVRKPIIIIFFFCLFIVKNIWKMSLANKNVLLRNYPIYSYSKQNYFDTMPILLCVKNKINEIRIDKIYSITMQFD